MLLVKSTMRHLFFAETGRMVQGDPMHVCLQKLVLYSYLLTQFNGVIPQMVKISLVLNRVMITVCNTKRIKLYSTKHWTFLLEEQYSKTNRKRKITHNAANILSAIISRTFFT